MRTRSALLFDADRVNALADWPMADEVALDEGCPWGIFIARRDVGVTTGEAEQLESVRDDRPLNLWISLVLAHRVREHGYLPFVATVSGYVALGAEIVAVGGRRGVTRFELRQPGEWFELLRGRRLPSGPGRPWVIRGWQLSARMGQSGT